jgi:hypothetical protein
MYMTSEYIGNAAKNKLVDITGDKIAEFTQQRSFGGALPKQ